MSREQGCFLLEEDLPETRSCLTLCEGERHEARTHPDTWEDSFRAPCMVRGPAMAVFWLKVPLQCVGRRPHRSAVMGKSSQQAVTWGLANKAHLWGD